MLRLMPSVAIALALAATLAGCTFRPQESTYGTKTRIFTANVPDGTTQLAVAASAQPMGGRPDITVTLRDTNGTVLATDHQTVGNSSTMMLLANLSGQTQLAVEVRVAGGDAGVGLVGTAITPGQPNTIVMQENVILQDGSGASPATNKSPSNSTNATNTTNTTG